MEEKREKTETEVVVDEDSHEDAVALDDEPRVLAEKIKKLREEVKKCEVERKEYLNGWQRSRADYVNYKKDEGKRLEDVARFVTAEFVGDMLPVLDSFDLAFSYGLSHEVEKGVLLIRAQFEDILKKRGITEIKIETGEKFNPLHHESIGEIESEYPVETVGEVVQKGYMFRDRVLRPARVRLARPKSGAK